MHGPNFVEPPPEIIDREPEWEVEQILVQRQYGRRKEKQYRVRWRGYSEAHDSWEPVQNIHAPELVQEFLKRNTKRDKRPTWTTHSLHTFESLPQTPLPLAHSTLQLTHQPCPVDPAPLKVLLTFNTP